MMTKIMWQNMNIADRLYKRKIEIAANEKILIPSEQLQLFIQDASAADNYYAFLAGWFLELTVEMVHAYERFVESLDYIFDAPTLEWMDEILAKKRQQIAWAKEIVHDAVKDPKILMAVDRWRKYVNKYLRHLNGIDGRVDYSAVKPENPDVMAYGPAPLKRSKPEWLLIQDLFETPQPFRHNMKVFMWHYATEIQVVDPMCYIFFGVDDMPFEFYLDFSRHIWDETRHHLMGARRLRQMGYDMKTVPLPYDENPIKDLEMYYAELAMVAESCSFTRKKKSMEAYYKNGDLISGMTAEIDIIDERMHVKFGKKWTPVMYKQRFNDERGIDELVREIIDRWIAADRLGPLTSTGQKSLTHFVFCGKIEFKKLNFETL